LRAPFPRDEIAGARHLVDGLAEVCPFQRPALVDLISLSVLPYCVRSVEILAKAIKDSYFKSRKSLQGIIVGARAFRLVFALFIRPG